jgi:dTMP kinase
MSNRSPRFITLEGGEGAGKSTQCRRLANALKSRGIDCVLTREPGGSPGAEDIRKILVDGEPGRWSALTEALLMFAARTDHVAQTIKPALARGAWVVCDRFTDSSFAYQGAGRGLDRETIRRIESVSINDFRPHLTLILDLPVDIGLARAEARAESKSRFERFDQDFHERLRAAFLDIARRAPERCCLIDAAGTEDEVAGRIWETVQARLLVANASA